MIKKMESSYELSDQEVSEIVDAWGRGFNPRFDSLGALARDLLRARGRNRVLCSLCGSNLLDYRDKHHCDRTKWPPKEKTRKYQIITAVELIGE